MICPHEGALFHQCIGNLQHMFTAPHTLKAYVPEGNSGKQVMIAGTMVVLKSLKPGLVLSTLNVSITVNQRCPVVHISAFVSHSSIVSALHSLFYVSLYHHCSLLNSSRIFDHFIKHHFVHVQKTVTRVNNGPAHAPFPPPFLKVSVQFGLPSRCTLILYCHKAGQRQRR